jgi:BirA family biotin operon repressor/biotin-[acetyl-CoA-carboxylase] ligase
MGLNGGSTADASVHDFAAVLGERPLQVYPALLSTEATAQGWARQGAPSGAVVVASYQASPRGRAGRPIELDVDRHLGFSLVLRTDLTPQREGWLYTVATVGITDVLGGEVRWPDAVVVGDRRVADLGVHAELGPARVDWAVVTVVVDVDDRERAALLRDLVAAIETASDAPTEDVLERHRARCATFGEDVTAMMIPMGPAGPRVEGRAVDVRDDGSLVVATDAGGRVAVRPQHLGELLPRTPGGTAQAPGSS